ncbi:MAG: uracil-DNA glycosylase [Rhodospirillales bacterium]|jgi:uracil-DNA glycosylase|nr:uracil-DNA glycosylase [Rhodospirillales bacterium]
MIQPLKAEFPSPDCALCPRLAQFRCDNQAAYPAFFNAPVPSFGDEPENVRLLIVGMAPGLKGANCTGRPFTGDYAGDLLYETLLSHGLASGNYDKHPDDGLTLHGCLITNAVKCVPPQNKLTGPEVNTCNDFLESEIKTFPNLRCILTLGLLAHGATLKALGEKKAPYKFAHNAHHTLPNGVILVNSYHCSRYNTNTGRLTTAMFNDVFDGIKSLIE